MGISTRQEKNPAASITYRPTCIIQITSGMQLSNWQSLSQYWAISIPRARAWQAREWQARARAWQARARAWPAPAVFHNHDHAV